MTPIQEPHPSAHQLRLSALQPNFQVYRRTLRTPYNSVSQVLAACGLIPGHRTSMTPIQEPHPSDHQLHLSALQPNFQVYRRTLRTPYNSVSQVLASCGLIPDHRTSMTPIQEPHPSAHQVHLSALQPNLQVYRRTLLTPHNSVSQVQATRCRSPSHQSSGCLALYFPEKSFKHNPKRCVYVFYLATDASWSALSYVCCVVLCCVDLRCVLLCCVVL
jgi:hypothetical protein